MVFFINCSELYKIILIQLPDFPVTEDKRLILIGFLSYAVGIYLISVTVIK